MEVEKNQHHEKNKALYPPADVDIDVDVDVEQSFLIRDSIATERTILLLYASGHSCPSPTSFVTRKKKRLFTRCISIANHWLWLWSHTAFFVGTVCAVAAASIDLKQALASVETDDDDWSDDDDDGGDASSLFSSGDPFMVWNTAKVLSVGSTIFYLLSSHSPPGRNEGGLQQEQQRFSMSALFALGALFDFFSSLLDDEDAPWPGFLSEVLSVHFFLVCAFWTSSRHCLNFTTSSSLTSEISNNKYIILGDFLFLVGALIDVATSYGDHPTVSDEEGRQQWIVNASMGLASSLTWMVDSILYLLADMLEDEDEDEDDDKDDEDTSSEEDTARCTLDSNSMLSIEDSCSADSGQSERISESELRMK